MNTFYLTMNEEAGEARIVTGITGQDAEVRRVVAKLRTVLADYMVDGTYFVEAEYDVEYLPEPGSLRLAVVVNVDEDDRVVVYLYNFGNTPPLALLYLLAEISTFAA